MLANILTSNWTNLNLILIHLPCHVGTNENVTLEIKKSSIDILRLLAENYVILMIANRVLIA